MSERRQKLAPLFTGATGLLVTLVSPNAFALKDDPTLGAEFRDTPAAAADSGAAATVDESQRPTYVPGYREAPSIGLSPYAPHQPLSLPGGATPNWGTPSSGDEFRFGFSGYLQQPFRTSIGKRDTAYVGQNETTFHGDIVVPGNSYGWFDHTNTVPGPWSQVNFNYGNDTVQSTVILGAWSSAQSQLSAEYFQPPSQAWFQAGFLTYTPDIGAAKLNINMGVYPDRYGSMAKYSGGRYGLALMGELQGVGTTATLALPLQSGLTLSFEGGIKGDYNKVPLGTVPDDSNEYALASHGSTYAVHGHVSAKWQKLLTGSLHYIHSWAQDDRIDDAVVYDQDTTQPYAMDGSIDLMGADIRADMDRFGYLYAGALRVKIDTAKSVTNLLKVLNVGGGKEYNTNFLGYASNANGALNIAAFQYTLSLGTLLRHPREFWGFGPDLILAFFGMYGSVESEAAEFDGVQMLKVGTEATYRMTEAVALELRLDHVSPNLDESERNFMVVTPRITLRSEWHAHETLSLQYSNYILGDGARVEGDQRLIGTVTGDPDEHLLAIYGTMWW